VGDRTIRAREAAFPLSDVEAGERVLADLARRHPAAPPAEPARRRLYVETADRRLAARGDTLHFAEEPHGGRLVWRSADGGRLRSLAARRPPGFATDLPPGPFRDRLRKVADVRRLLPVAQARRVGHGLALRDKRGKTVARVALERWSLPGKRRGTPVLRAVAVRGYEKAFDDLVAGLRADLGEPAAAHPIVELGLLDAALGAPSPKLAVELDPEMRTDEAAKRILRALLDAIRANEEGTRQAIDTEFLHEFRVAVRRTRALLSRFKRAFAIRSIARFRREIRWLGSVTGPLRDLDVYILKFDGYVADGDDSLDPLRKHLLRRQREERSALRRVLASKRYAKLMGDWGAFLGKPVPARTTLPDARRPIAEYAREHIWKLHKRVLRDGRAIHDDTPAEAVHELRLDCKKLRYMMEFCRSLFEPEAMAAQIQALKRLQDTLGDFNDLEVQQGKIGAFAEEMAEVPRETAVAMGRLIERLRERQDAERERFGRRFPEFDGRENRVRARRLFRAAEPGA